MRQSADRPLSFEGRDRLHGPCRACPAKVLGSPPFRSGEALRGAVKLESISQVAGVVRTDEEFDVEIGK